MFCYKKFFFSAYGEQYYVNSIYCNVCSGAGDSASTSKPSDSKSSQPNYGHRGRGRDSGDRGRGRGRGRMSANVIQTHSLFEQGPTEKVNKPSGGKLPPSTSISFNFVE